MLLRCPEPGLYLDIAGRPCDISALQRRAGAVGDEDPLILVVPASHCLFTTLPVTPAEQRHLARLLPWKLEDSLIAPAENLHVAHGAVREGSVGVTAVARDWFIQLLQQARHNGLQPAQVICELELLPWHSGAWVMQLQHQAGQLQWLLRYGAHEGMVCSNDNLPLLLQILAAERGGLPRSLLVQCTVPDLQTLCGQLPSAWHEIIQQTAATWSGPLPAQGCNLLQGSFAPPLPWHRWWQQWRVAATLALGLLLTDLFLTGAGIWSERQALAQLQAAVLNEVETVLPGAVLVDPVLQLRRLVAARGGQSDSGLLSLLTRMAPALNAQVGVRVEGLDYRGDQGELQLLVETLDFAAVENLRAALAALGLRAELLGSSREGGRSRSRLRVQV